MQVPVQVTFREMPVSDAVETACWREAEKLERFHDRITSCRVVIGQMHRRHRKGNLFQVGIDLTVPGREIVVNREPPEHHSDEEIGLAIREAFDTARRRLDEHARRISGRLKTHASPPQGLVRKLFQDQGFGFIATSEGRELYFHRNSVLNEAFDQLEVGSPVRFAEEDGAEGPQASSVTLVGRHNQVGP